MPGIHVLVEGQTEEVIVRDVLGPELQPALWLNPVILKTKRPAGGSSHKGGVGSWEKIERDLRLLLMDSSVAVVTTMLDYYGLPGDTPGMADRPSGSPYDRVVHVEQAVADRIADRRFLPHLALHETEAWVLAAAEQLGELLGEPEVARTLRGQVRDADGPERVNDGHDTAPSKRILATYPAYRKTQDGPIAIACLGLAKLREACPHFDAWLTELVSR